MPPTIQARYTSLAEPTACIISDGTRKMPLPMIVPTTMAAAWLTFRSRARSSAEFTGFAIASGMSASGLLWVFFDGHTCEHADQERDGGADHYVPGEWNL